ncbi:MAG: hypothetical protein FWF52_06745 [Candidatus Azobacteroides sp.]|nr:hypothetical protein [Candidatus Azobacteroides sp.]
MKLFSSQTEAAKKQWAQNLTLEQIEEYERKGMDMSEYRRQYEENRAAKQKEMQERMDAIALEKLDAYKNARSAEDAFIVDVAKFNKLSDKEKSKLELAPLVYGRVVQAHWELFKPNANDKYARGIVFLFALDDAHRYNEEWLAKTANRISEMKESVDKNQSKGIGNTLINLFNLEKNAIVASIVESQKLKTVPEDCRELIKTLRNDRSSFCFPLSKTLADDADAWCATYTLDKASKLPQSRIPYNRIIPFLLSEQPKRKFLGITNSIQLIPPTYYTK